MPRRVTLLAKRHKKLEALSVVNKFVLCRHLLRVERDMPEIIGDGVRRQFSCTSCDGRAWLDRPEVLSVCHQCNQPGELVEEGEEIEPRQFQCETCDGRVWYKRAERSKCHECENYGRLVPEGREIEYRQFVCENAACEHLGHRWQTMAERSKCRHCSEHGEMVPTGDSLASHTLTHERGSGQAAIVELC